MKKFNLFLLTICFFLITSRANCLELAQAPMEKTLTDSINKACLVSQNFKTFTKNFKEFTTFIPILKEPEGLEQVQPISYANSKFVPPILTTQGEISLYEIKTNPELRTKMTTQIVLGLYFNILKDEKLIQLQKELISQEKEIFDIEKETGNFKEITEATESYTDAQNELFEYQKAKKLCTNQLLIFTQEKQEPIFQNSIDDFDIENSIKKILNDSAKSQEITLSQQEILIRMRYDYLKYKNLSDKIKKLSSELPPEEYYQESQSKKQILNIQKQQATAKLSCIIDYIGFCNAK